MTALSRTLSQTAEKKWICTFKEADMEHGLGPIISLGPSPFPNIDDMHYQYVGMGGGLLTSPTTHGRRSLPTTLARRRRRRSATVAILFIVVIGHIAHPAPPLFFPGTGTLNETPCSKTPK